MPPAAIHYGRIISIACIAEGDDVAVLDLPKARVPFGDGVTEPSVHPGVGAIPGKPLAQYALA